MVLIVIFALVAAVALFVAAPLRPGHATSVVQAEAAARAELEAERDARYREIRDAELDYRTGKLSEAEWRDQDRGLKREAMEVLRRLDALDGAAAEASRPAAGADA